MATCLRAIPQTHVAPQASGRTQIVILGTLHDFHKSNTNYSSEVLRHIIVQTKPSAILVELPPEIDGRKTVEHGRVTPAFDFNENTAANMAADALGVEIVPFDREGRNESYNKTHYFSRQTAASERASKWIEAQMRMDPESPQAQACHLESEAQEKQMRLYKNGSPETINSPMHDMIIATKHGIDNEILPNLLAVSGEQALAAEFRFFAKEWQERNQIMVSNIVAIARKHHGQCLVVLIGSEHRYILRDLLVNVPEVRLREFYRTNEWNQSAWPAP
jgi:hypothetical protein